MSEFPEFIEDWFGVWSEPSYKQAQEIHRALRQVDAGIVVEESSEFTPQAWTDLVERIRDEKGRGR